VESRLRLFNAKKLPVVITNAPLFGDKASLFPRCVFVVGVDTAVRIVDPKYYPAAPASKTLGGVLEGLRAAGTRFVVGGRVRGASREGGEEVFETMADVEGKVPEGYREMFVGLSEEEFRADISSTMIRNRQAKV